MIAESERPRVDRAFHERKLGGHGSSVSMGAERSINPQVVSPSQVKRAMPCASTNDPGA